MFLTRGLEVLDVRHMGKQREHMRLRIQGSDGEWVALAFNQGARWGNGSSHVDLVYTMTRDSFGGPDAMAMRVLDFCWSES